MSGPSIEIDQMLFAIGLVAILLLVSFMVWLSYHLEQMKDEEDDARFFNRQYPTDEECTDEETGRAGDTR